MTPQELRNSILQLAIQGKLVEHRPEEGTAKELFQQIQEEKRRLVKEGKIKKEKSLSKVAEDEMPFEIPEDWMWVRVGEVFAHNTGKAMNSGTQKAGKSGEIRKFITTSNLYWNSFDFSSVKEMFFSDDELDRCTVTKGDLLMCEGGAYYGRTAIWDYDYDICFQNHVHRLRPYKPVELLFFYYLFYFYKSMNMMRAKGTAMPGLSSQTLHQMVVPLPPFAEQRRIVAKIEELLPYIDRYEQAWTRLEQFNKQFPVDMQKSILQLAIQGKLVEQRPEDGVVENIYPPIQEELPFDIPQNWKWVRLLDIIKGTPSNGLSPKGVDYKTKVKDLTLTATSSGKFKPDAFKYVDIELEFDSKYWLKNGDLLIQRSNSRELVGTSCVYTGKDNEYIYPDLMMKLQIKDDISAFYVDYVLKAPLSRFYFIKSASGTSESMPKINQRIVSKALIPLPPLAEQKRIVARLEELLPLCERLK